MLKVVAKENTGHPTRIEDHYGGQYRNSQITLPKVLRDKIGLRVGDYLEIAVVDGTIVPRPVKLVSRSKEKRGAISREH